VKRKTKKYRQSLKRINYDLIVQHRFIVFTVITILLFLILSFKLSNVMINEKEKYIASLDKLTYSTVEGESSPRGRILDRNHNIIVDKKHYTILEKLVAHFWIEFVVECKSGEQHFRSEVEFCDSFITTKWDIQYIKGNRDDIKDLYWLMYTTPYFIALCFINNCFDYYFGKITDEQIAILVQKLYVICTDLYKRDSFDNYDKIKSIGEIFEETFNTKSKNYEELYL